MGPQSYREIVGGGNIVPHRNRNRGTDKTGERKRKNNRGQADGDHPISPNGGADVIPARFQAFGSDGLEQRGQLCQCRKQIRRRLLIPAGSERRPRFQDVIADFLIDLDAGFSRILEQPLGIVKRFAEPGWGEQIPPRPLCRCRVYRNPIRPPGLRLPFQDLPVPFARQPVPWRLYCKYSAYPNDKDANDRVSGF